MLTLKYIKILEFEDMLTKKKYIYILCLNFSVEYDK